MDLAPLAIQTVFAKSNTGCSCIVPRSKRGRCGATIIPAGTIDRRRAAFGASAVMLSLLTSEHRADALSCPGKSGYALQQCLRDLRRAKQEAEGEETEVQEEVLKTRQYEQPGELVTLPSGIQYREMLEGNVGPPAEYGSVCEISYIVYRLASGAYFKYSSGGTPVFLFSLGYGNEGKDDVGSTYRFVLGEPDAVPAAVNVAMVGMRQGGRRRVLTPPGAGWNRPGRTVKPIPDTFGGRRRLETHKDEPLLFEVELRRVYPPGSLPDAEVPLGGVTVRLDRPFQLPAPPSPFRKLLGDAS